LSAARAPRLAPSAPWAAGCKGARRTAAPADLRHPLLPVPPPTTTTTHPQAMGNKTAARRAALECGVPIVPGTNHALKSAEEAKDFANRWAPGPAPCPPL
jgi:biotin carboxylase